MYKTNLQELCQRYSMTLPEYKVTRDGPNHSPRFTAAVTVNGLSFQSSQCRSTKDAQNIAARFAFEYFSANPPGIYSPQIFSDAAAPAPAPAHVGAYQPVLQSPSTPLQPYPARLAADLAFLPPQLQQIPRETISSASAQLAGPQPVHPSLLQQTQIHNPSFPSKISTVASTPYTNVGQSKGSDTRTSVVTLLSSGEPASARGMYKSKLLELCRKHSWKQPEYSTVKEGPDHNPRFGATVIVNGIPFQTPNNHCRSSKEAANLAANIAFDHLSTDKPTVPQQRHFPSTASSFSGHINNEMTDQNNENIAQTSEFSSTPFLDRENSKSSGMQYIYKNQLQQYAQKQNIAFPNYSCEIEGPPHNRRFRSKVDFCGKTFESQGFFSTLKDAEQAAAKVALEALSPDEIQKGGALYKTLLQQLAQKQGCLFPVYKTVQSGPPHAPTFMATVEVGGETFQGQEAKSKKQAEMNAAEVAYNSCLKCTDIGSKRQKTSTTPAIHPSPDNRSSPSLPFERSTKSAIESSAESDVKETDKIVVLRSTNNPNVGVSAPTASVLPSNQSSTPLELQHLTNSIEEFDLKRPAVKEMILVYPRGSKEMLPDCASILPCSDQKWMAVEVEMNNNKGRGTDTSTMCA